MSVALTRGAIEALVQGSQVDNPVLQLLNMRSIDCSSGQTRFRLKMSDGQHSLSSLLLASQLNYLVEENLLVPTCVCMLKKTTTSTLSDGRLVVTVIDMEILQSAEETGGMIGNPTPSYARDKTSSSEDSISSPPACSSSVAVPGPSYEDNITHSPPQGWGRSFGGTSPMKMSPMKMSPMKMSPMKASPMKASPMKASPMKASPMKASPMKMSPMKMSPMKMSPMKMSPMKATSSSPGSSTKVMPIAELNPYQSKWTIRARVTNKSNVRTWSNSRGDGKLFSFEIVDESGEIKITAFNNEVDTFFSLVEQGKVYYISKATLKVANKKYNSLKNDYEMTLHANTSIVPCDDGQEVPTVQCDFVPIAQLENRDKDAVIDVIGVCKSAEDVSRITTKTSREVSKRALHLIDRTGKVVSVTLWGEEAEKFDGTGQPVVAIKGARLSDFGGRSLSVLFSSTLMVNPDIPEAFRLRAWYDQEGFALDSQSLTETRSVGSGAKMNWKTLSDVKNEHMGHGEKADYFTCLATVLYMRKENCLYQACPSANCNKKVVDQQNGLYRCEKCNREFPNFKYRFLLYANLADFGDNQWVTCFQETAEVLLGHSAETLGHLRDTDETAFNEVFQKANFTTHIFKNRVKLETYNDEIRVKATVMEVQPVDHREYSRRLLSNIRRLAS
uniref:Replication protein A subunit n=1 Tax=Scophthalmus maximus TaxID=52904 RepID=A0A8D3DZ14_SCOMX